MISYKYNIYRSKKTKHLNKMLGECCFVWNHALSLQKRYYRMSGKYISIGRMQKHFAKRIKRNLLHSQTVQEILERLDESYSRFFKKRSKRPPKFKRFDRFNSFVFKQGGFMLNGNIFTINKGKKRFKFSYSRHYEGNIKQIRIIRETCHRFSLIIVTDHNPVDSYRKTHDGASVGLDFGLKTYLTKSDGSEIASPLFFKRYQDKIKKCGKRVSNAKKGSNNRSRRLFELQQVHRKINNLKSDFQWKLAHELCKRYDYIFIEDLNIEAMRRIWGKKISDLCHSSFIDNLMYVSLKYGVIVHKIDKWYPSSKTCECGYINKLLSLKDRKWICPECESINDRDVLAARNILRKGISELESKSNSSDSNIGVSCVCIQESHLL
nr:MAG TPA: endonuclease [Caudoviricetes sp.]